MLREIPESEAGYNDYERWWFEYQCKEWEQAEAMHSLKKQVDKAMIDSLEKIHPGLLRSIRTLRAAGLPGRRFCTDASTPARMGSSCWRSKRNSSAPTTNA